MQSRSWRGVAVAALLLAGRGLAAPPSPVKPAEKGKPTKPAQWQQGVEARKKAAARYAAARKWDLALREIGLAKLAVEEAGRDARRKIGSAPRPPEYQKELKRLIMELNSDRKLAFQHKESFEKSVRQFEKKRDALDRKYGINRKDETASRQKMLADAGRFTLELAALDDLASKYYTGKGDDQGAVVARENSLKERLEAYQALGKTDEAAKEAEKVAALNSANPDLYDAAGRFFMQQKQFPRAAAVWQREIDLIETGRAAVRVPNRRAGGVRPVSPRDPRERLPILYRQLAFALHRQGKADEARRALQKAGEPRPRS